MPFDATPLTGTSADVAARIGWLLRINRLGSAFGAMTAKKWAAELGLEPTSHTEISKLERGAKSPSAAVLSRYECVLGYVPGTFRGVIDGLRRRLSPRHHVTKPARQQRWVVDDLANAIAAGTMTGEQWLQLADFLSSDEARAVPRRVVAEWMRTLAMEFATSPGLLMAPRLEALCVIASSGRSAELEDMIWGLVERTPEHARRLICVLGSSTRAGIVSDLISLMLDGEGERLYGVAAALSDQLVHAHVQQEHLAALQQIARDAGTLSGALARGLLVSAGAQHRSDERAHRLTEARMRQAPGLQRYLSAIQDAGAPDDKMAKRLLQEALVPILPGRALPAQMLLAASPYRHVIVDEANAIADDTNATRVEREAVANLAWIG